MFTRLAVTALTLTVLGAGAFAFAPGEQPRMSEIAVHTTIVEKNQVWPVKGFITMNPCAAAACLEV